jgi:hypothetical protein
MSLILKGHFGPMLGDHAVKMSLVQGVKINLWE